MRKDPTLVESLRWSQLLHMPLTYIPRHRRGGVTPFPSSDPKVMREHQVSFGAEVKAPASKPLPPAPRRDSYDFPQSLLAALKLSRGEDTWVMDKDHVLSLLLSVCEISVNYKFKAILAIARSPETYTQFPRSPASPSPPQRRGEQR